MVQSVNDKFRDDLVRPRGCRRSGGYPRRGLLVGAVPTRHKGRYEQNAFFGTPAHGVGMLASRGSAIITVRVCFGYLA
jgi:hypothetical protein